MFGGKKWWRVTAQGAGLMALALLAGSVGYTIYSFSNDRVKSPAK